MRVRMIWHTVISKDFKYICEVLETQFRNALRSLAFALENAQNSKPNSQYFLLKQKALPIYATADWPNRPQSIADFPFLDKRGDLFVIELIDAGRIEIRALGSKTSIEVYTHDTGATQHLIPVIALLKTQLAILENDYEIRVDFPNLHKIVRYTRDLGLDVADNSGQVLAAVVLDKLIIEIKKIGKKTKYQNYMWTKGIDRIVKSSLFEFAVQNKPHKQLKDLSVRWFFRGLGLIGLTISVVWLIVDGSYEPMITAVGSLATFAASFFGQQE